MQYNVFGKIFKGGFLGLFIIKLKQIIINLFKYRENVVTNGICLTNG